MTAKRIFIVIDVLIVCGLYLLKNKKIPTLKGQIYNLTIEGGYIFLASFPK